MAYYQYSGHRQGKRNEPSIVGAASVVGAAVTPRTAIVSVARTADFIAAAK